MKITNAQYWKHPLYNKVTHIYCNIEGREFQQQVPIDSTNTDYVEIKKQLDAGTLTIKDAE